MQSFLKYKKKAMNKKIFGLFQLFVLWRSFDFLVIFFSQKIIPYLGFFPYRDQLLGFHLPSWIYALANFDGLHYISIARGGYGQFEQAFFPLYPLLIKFLSPLFSSNQLMAGLVISNVSFLAGLIIFYKYLKLIFSKNLAFNKMSIIYLLLFPTSFFFGAVYTEGLFFLFLTLTLYFLKKEKYLVTAVFVILASLTRLIGVFLLIPIALHLWKKNRKPLLNIKNLVLFAPLLGLAAYCLYLFKTTGDPFFFLTSQPLFGANRSSHLIILPQVYWRYLKIFLTAAHDTRFYVSVIEFLIFNFVLFILILDLFKNLKFKIKNYDLLAINIFSFANLILPTLTGTFSSIPRYALFSISIFIYIPGIKNSFIKYLMIIIFLILHILLLGFFTQGYFIS